MSPVGMSSLDDALLHHHRSGVTLYKYVSELSNNEIKDGILTPEKCHIRCNILYLCTYHVLTEMLFGK